MPSSLRPRLFVALLLALGIGAVGMAPSQAQAPSGSPGPPPLDDVSVQLTEVAGIDQPIAMATRAGTDDLYIARRPGSVKRIDVNGSTMTVVSTPVLSFQQRVSTAGEGGFLGLAFSPDGSKLYVHYSNINGHNRVDEYRMSGNQAVVSSRRQVLKIQHPGATNHYGGDLHFGPDGHLYVAVGDGGGANDPSNNAQNINALLGKVLRINPTPSSTAAYRNPAGNPFVGVNGANEIWFYGVRNPWRFSFDRLSGDLWLGDVGQGLREEIDFLPNTSGGGNIRGRGENLGWRIREGSLDNPAVGGTLSAASRVDPVFEYPTVHGEECAVVGGYVYRGANVPDLLGTYLYSDFCASDLRGVRQVSGTATEDDILTPPAASGSVQSLGEDSNGEVYVITTSKIYRVDPGP